MTNDAQTLLNTLRDISAEAAAGTASKPAMGKLMKQAAHVRRELIALGVYA